MPIFDIDQWARLITALTAVAGLLGMGAAAYEIWRTYHPAPDAMPSGDVIARSLTFEDYHTMRCPRCGAGLMGFTADAPDVWTCYRCQWRGRIQVSYQVLTTPADV